MDQTPIAKQEADAAAAGQRREQRDSLLVLAKLRVAGGGDVETVRVRNVSSGGLMAQAPEGFPSGTEVEVELEGVGLVSGVVAWAEAGRIGIAFDHPIEKALARKTRTAGETMPLASPITDFRRPPLRTG